MSRWHTTGDENFNNAPSRSVTGGGSRTTPRAKKLFSEEFS